MRHQSQLWYSLWSKRAYQFHGADAAVAAGCIGAAAQLYGHPLIIQGLNEKGAKNQNERST
jgi:hypothetical protein